MKSESTVIVLRQGEGEKITYIHQIHKIFPNVKLQNQNASNIESLIFVGNHKLEMNLVRDSLIFSNESISIKRSNYGKMSL